MSKMDEYFRGERDAYKKIYKIYKDQGLPTKPIEAIMCERGITDPDVYLAPAQRSHELKLYKSRCLEFSNCMALIVLHRSFGFGLKRLTRFIREWRDISVRILGNECGFYEIFTQMKNSTGIEVEFQKLFNDTYLFNEAKELKEHRSQYECAGTYTDIFGDEWEEDNGKRDA